MCPPLLMMGSNGALEASRTSSSMSSSPAHTRNNAHISENNMNNYMSDDNPEIDHQMASLFDPNIQVTRVVMLF